MVRYSVEKKLDREEKEREREKWTHEGIGIGRVPSLFLDIFYFSTLIRKPVPRNYLEIPLQCYHTLPSPTLCRIVSRDRDLGSSVFIKRFDPRELDT